MEPNEHKGEYQVLRNSMVQLIHALRKVKLKNKALLL